MKQPTPVSMALCAFTLLMTATSATALTPPVMTISDSLGETVTLDSAGTITFGGACTPSTCFSQGGGLVVSPGSITWSGSLNQPNGSYGIRFVNFQGQSKPALPPPQTSMGGRVINNANQAVTVNLEWSDTGFDPGDSPATMNASVGTAPLNSGFPGPGVLTDVTYNGYVDTTNILNGETTHVNTITFPPVTSATQTQTATGPGPSSDPFSMTEVVSFTMSTQPTYAFSNFTLQSSPYPPLHISCPAASGQVGVPYSEFLNAFGGDPPYTFSVIAGSLPPGLMLDPASGLISGTPTTPGNYPFTVEVTDASGTLNSAHTPCGIAITAAAGPHTMTSSTSTGNVSMPYNSSLVTTGGTPPYTFSIVSGSLPKGLFLNAASGAITGTPTTPGASVFAAQATDASGNITSGTTRILGTILISPAPPLIGRGDTAAITFWSGTGQILIKLLNGGPSSASLANWLATQYPYLYGATSPHNLTNKTNAYVAALFPAYTAAGQTASAQILGTALASYVTNPSLSGATAVLYGFNSFLAGGTGAMAWNVGADGAAVGLRNNTSYTIQQLLAQANFNTQNGTFNGNAFGAIFSAINQTGGIN